MEDFDQIFFPSLGTHIECKVCAMVSAQRGAGNCDADSRSASYCGGLHIHLPRNLCSRAPYVRSVISRFDAAIFSIFFWFGIHKLARQLHKERTQMEVQ